MMSKMDLILRKVLNDPDIFWIRKEIFKKDEWSDLRKDLRKLEEFNKKVDIKIQKLEEEKNKEQDNKKKKTIEAAIEQCKGIKTTLEQNPYLAKQLFDNLESFGIVQSNLPNMDDYGKIIERHNFSIVEQFFLDKIKRENNPHKKKALKKVLGYVKELAELNQSILEIAFFVRKLDSLQKLWEVSK